MPNTAKKFDQELPFATYGPDQVPIKESDIPFVASIIGYAKRTNTELTAKGT